MSGDSAILAREVKENAVFRMEESLRMVKGSIEMIQDEDLWKRPNKASNSIGNIMVHLLGNITQYILSGLGERKDVRCRDDEFSAREGRSATALLADLTALVDEVKIVINGLKEEQLSKRYQVQGFDLSGIGILLHVVEHFSYHTGQIAFWVKYQKNKDLGFYKGVDLNLKNKPEC
jgi:uncharacterized damage-inducible protein DinB